MERLKSKNIVLVYDNSSGVLDESKISHHLASISSDKKNKITIKNIDIINDCIQVRFMFERKSNYALSLFNIIFTQKDLKQKKEVIMNSLYGRFGLGTDISIMEFIDSKYYAIYKHIFNVTNFNEDLGFICFNIKNIDESKNLFDDWCSENNIKLGYEKELRKKVIGKYSKNAEPYRAVQISAAIASYARITMWKDME